MSLLTNIKIIPKDKVSGKTIKTIEIYEGIAIIIYDDVDCSSISVIGGQNVWDNDVELEFDEYYLRDYLPVSSSSIKSYIGVDSNNCYGVMEILIKHNIITQEMIADEYERLKKDEIKRKEDQESKLKNEEYEIYLKLKNKFEN